MIIRLAHTDSGEYGYVDVPVIDENGIETGTEKQWQCIRQPMVYADVLKLLPHWNFKRHTERVTKVDGTYQFGSHPFISGNRIDVIDAGDRVLEPAEYDSEGNQTKEAVMAGEIRIDIHVPEDYPLPQFDTQVFPENPDKLYT